MTATLDEAEALAGIVAASGRPFALTYTYTGYAMVREARARIDDGAIGRVRKTMVDYPRGWLAAPIEDSNTQASWRTAPTPAGGGGALGHMRSAGRTGGNEGLRSIELPGWADLLTQ